MILKDVQHMFLIIKRLYISCSSIVTICYILYDVVHAQCLQHVYMFLLLLQTKALHPDVQWEEDVLQQHSLLFDADSAGLETSHLQLSHIEDVFSASGVYALPAATGKGQTFTIFKASLQQDIDK